MPRSFETPASWPDGPGETRPIPRAAPGLRDKRWNVVLQFSPTG